MEEFDGIREWSLSLSCPAAAEMMLNRKEALSFVVEEDENEDPLEAEFEDFDFTEAGVRVICDVESTGYEGAGSGTLWSLDDGACYFFTEFTMSNQN